MVVGSSHGLLGQPFIILDKHTRMTVDLNDHGGTLGRQSFLVKHSPMAGHEVPERGRFTSAGGVAYDYRERCNHLVDNILTS